MITNDYTIDGAPESLFSEIHRWYNTDTEQSFKKNYKKNKTILEHFNSRPVLYHINRCRFRSPFEFDSYDPDDTMITIGCSHTFGVGNRWDDIWPVLVSKELNLKLYNLGFPGGATDSCYRLLSAWIGKAKPKVVFMLEPQISRREFLLNDKIQVILPFMKEQFDVLRRYWGDEEDVKHAEIIKNAISHLCEINNAKFYHIPFLSYKHGYVDKKDFGRDMMHFGPETHKLISQQLLEKIK